VQEKSMFLASKYITGALQLLEQLKFIFIAFIHAQMQLGFQVNNYFGNIKL
jgi:hypothetical protein